MIDPAVQKRIIGEIERMLLLARAGEVQALAAAIIVRGDVCDTVIEMEPRPILIPAVCGTLDMLKTQLEMAQFNEALARRSQPSSVIIKGDDYDRESQAVIERPLGNMANGANRR